MSDQSYDREELAKMNRLQLRRICKDRGMSSDEAAKAHSNDMIAFIQEAQGDEPEEPMKTETKTTTSKGNVKGKDKLAAKRGRKPPSRKAKEPEPEDQGGQTGEGNDEGGAKGEVNIDNSALLVFLTENFEALAKRIDTVGEVVDQNFQDLTSDVGELRVDSHQVKAGVAHTYYHLRGDEILTDDAAPDGRDIDDVFAMAEEECSDPPETGGDE